MTNNYNIIIIKKTEDAINIIPMSYPYLIDSIGTVQLPEYSYRNDVNYLDQLKGLKNLFASARRKR
jgi:hypothetical protein